ncbi:MAG: hypothetical protein Q9218_000102 [Villophora microphyllina]
MTVTIEEWLAHGWTREELFEFWASDNRGMQQHKFTRLFHLSEETLQQWWPLPELHEFCLKLCAIYATVQLTYPRQLSEYLWTKWFRKGETQCRFGDFFARPVGSYQSQSPNTVAELLDAHCRICAQVLLRQVSLTTRDFNPNCPVNVDDRVDSPHVNHENYRLEATFLAVFIIIDTPNQDIVRAASKDQDELVAAIPVLLVRTGDYHDLRSGPVDFGPVETISEEIDGNQDVRRIALGHAVDFILSLHMLNSVRHEQYR